MKFGDKVTGFVILILLSCLFIGGLAGTLNAVLYMTIGADDIVPIRDITKSNDDEFILSYTYFNKITQKSYVVERAIDNDQYKTIEGKPNLKIQYVGYFPGSPHIEGVDPKRPLLIIILVLVLVALGIRRNIQFLKGKLTAEQFT